MKNFVFLLICMIGMSTIPCSAQNTYDLIQQLLLDAKKLESLKATLNDMYKGYKILDKGYTEIRDLAKGRFDLHKHFLDALLKVSPVVRNDSRTNAIMHEVQDLKATYRQMTTVIQSSRVFTPQELDYFDAMYNVLYQHSQQSLDELNIVTTEGQLRMSDAQRLRAIGRIQRDVSGQTAALQQLYSGAVLQMVQRQHQQNEIKFLKQWYANP